MSPEGRSALLRVVIVAAIALSGTVALRSQQIPQPPTPTFRAGVEVVEVDAFVTDEKGNPVRGLTADDFEVFERGQRQTITTFAAVDIPPSPGRPAETDVESDVLTNNDNEGDPRVYLFALDGADAANALRARHFLRGFMNRHFRENDLAAVVMGQGLATDGQDFTRNRRLLLAAIDKYQGGGGDLRDLRDRVEFLARMPNARKAVLWITEAVTFDAYTIVDYLGGVLSLKNEYAHGIISAATRGNIRIYPISPHALDPFAMGAGHVENRGNFHALAAVTGGFALIDSNNFTGTFERLIQETSTYYVLGYESSAKSRPGRYTGFEVRVKRPGLRVKARPGYVEELDYLKRKRKPETPQVPVAAALATPMSVPGIPMRVVATPFREKGSNATVALTLDIDASGLQFFERSGQYETDFEIRLIATDARNKLHPEFRHPAKLTLPPAVHQRLTETGLRVVTEFGLPSGRYQIRVASAGATSSGSVVYDLDVPDFRKESLSMSGVALTSDAAAGVFTMQTDLSDRSAKPRECGGPVCVAEVRGGTAMTSWTAQSKAPFVWQGVLPAPPTAERHFTTANTVTAFLEVYDNSKQQANAEPYAIDVTTTLRNTEGAIVRTVSQQKPSAAARRLSGGHAFVVPIQLGGIEPGSYVLQFEARAEREPARIVSRRIPIRVN